MTFTHCLICERLVASHVVRVVTLVSPVEDGVEATADRTLLRAERKVRHYSSCLVQPREAGGVHEES